MKKLICLLTAVIAGIVFAEGEYELAKKLNIKDKASLQAITKDNVQAVYDACIANTNWDRAQLVCCVAYALGNKDMYIDYASKVPVIGNKSNLEYWTLMHVMNTISNTKYEVGLLDIDPKLGIELCKKFIERGDLVSGSLIYMYPGVLDKGNVIWDDYMTKELRDYILSVYTPEVVKSSNLISYEYWHLINFLSYIDRYNGDSNYTLVNSYWSTEIAKTCVDIAKWMPGVHQEYYELVLIHSTKCGYKISATKSLDRILGDKSKSESIWNFVSENGTWKERIDLAWYLDDADKVIDAFKLKLTEDIDSVDVDKFIKMIVGLDSEYRKAEVLSILKNINNKCTLNLYDDQKTWEPIIAKIRAMIDLRK